ncbi:AAA family ATPase [Guptibacillus hwajinpoensis]|uniref:AAA family ATPase n=1 Tax=Guptibacillus hwajinpoensis TaxID=208199 RepID=UPI0024B37B28|nr:AAA family ATPase [Pseudalkalibacillus hwajinpoensis]
MNKKNDYPDLSNLTIGEKKKTFIDKRIIHPILDDVYSKVSSMIEEGPKGQVFLVYGPTGVGKSTLFNRVKNDIRKKHNCEKKTTTIPIVCLELPAPDSGKFNWKDFYKRMLIEMQEPLVNKKISKSLVRKPNLKNHLPATAPELRESLENCIVHRKTGVILLDEAQHLLKVASAKGIQDQMDALKSIANITGVKLFLFGTYELMDFFDLNGQLGRRTNEIHFSRYNLDIEEELIAFKNVINTFQSHLPLDKPQNLINFWEFLYERSLGCIGILKNWLDECLKDVLNSNLSEITLSVLERNAPSPTKALRIADEILNGERKLQEQRVNNRILLRQRLGLEERSAIPKENKEIVKTKKKSVGKRNPMRDPIGIKEG